jgi:hypothetical protein
MVPPKFFVVAPMPRHSSAGITVLHQLLEDLRALGHDAIWVPVSKLNEQDVFQNGIPLESSHASSVVIYPETISGNPLGAVNVVRYYLNVEGAVRGNRVSPQPNEFRLAYAPEFHASPNYILTKLVNLPEPEPWDDEEFEDRTACATFIGKGNRYNQCFIIPDSLEITLFDPPSKEELFGMLRHLKLLYTWDSASALNLEAILLGTIPVLLSALPVVADTGMFGRLPMGSTTWKDGEPAFFLPADFGEQRNALVQRIDQIKRRYPDQLRGAIAAIRQHFDL